MPPEQEHGIGDFTALDRPRYLVIERDFLQGEAAQFSKVFLVDLLHIRDPRELSLRGPVRPGDVGLGQRFEFPSVTTEAVLPVGEQRGGNRLDIVNDNNVGGVGGRNPALPDYTDFIRLRVPDLRRPGDRG